LSLTKLDRSGGVARGNEKLLDGLDRVEHEDTSGSKALLRRAMLASTPRDKAKKLETMDWTNVAENSPDLSPNSTLENGRRESGEEPDNPDVLLLQHDSPPTDGSQTEALASFEPHSPSVGRLRAASPASIELGAPLRPIMTNIDLRASPPNLPSEPRPLPVTRSVGSMSPEELAKLSVHPPRRSGTVGHARSPIPPALVVPGESSPEASLKGAPSPRVRLASLGLPQTSCGSTSPLPGGPASPNPQPAGKERLSGYRLAPRRRSSLGSQQGSLAPASPASSQSSALASPGAVRPPMTEFP